MSQPGNRGAALARVITGAALVIVVCVLMWVPMFTLGLLAFVALLVGAGLHEFYALARARGARPVAPLGIAIGVALIPLAYWVRNPGHYALLTTALLCAVTMGRSMQGLKLPENATQGLAKGMDVTLHGLCYVGVLGAHTVMLHGLPDHGPGLLTLLIAAVALSDTGAYVVGSTMGKHKLAPRLSPKKTWEGAIGAVVFAMAAGAVIGLLGHGWFPAWPVTHFVLAAAVLSVAGQLGDLTESRLKREAGVKDSGNIFPGHGGVLDRCDGFLFAAPVLYYLVKFVPMFA